MAESTIPVSPEVAIAYRSASPQERQKIQAVIGMLLHKQADSDLVLLRQIMDEIGDRAQARGLTPEILESILDCR